jgi:hypothetical protein
MLIDVIGRRQVCVGIAIHQATPRTPHGTDIQQNRAIQFAGTPEGLWTPRIPINGLGNCLFQVRRRLPAEVIEVSLRRTGSDYARQAQHQQKDIPAHANQIHRGRKSYDPPDRDALALSEKLRSGEVIVLLFRMLKKARRCWSGEKDVRRGLP